MPRRKTTETDALSTRQLSPNKAKASILHALKIKRPIFVWGGPGIGKSEVIHQIAKNIDAHVIDIRLSLWEPTDIKVSLTLTQKKIIWFGHNLRNCQHQQERRSTKILFCF